LEYRTVFIVSDGTGITAGALSKLLEHFPNTTFTQSRLPFTDNLDKIIAAQVSIEVAAKASGLKPIVIMSLGDIALRNKLKETPAYFIDLFEKFIDPLGEELGQQPLTGAGIAHRSMGASYHERMEAINFTLTHDDGMTNSGLDEAEVILVGVSRCGKTPTSIYLAMQFGIKAANYPLIPEDFERGILPEALIKNMNKIFGLTIRPERLHSVRSERRPGSFYASLENCRKEIITAENLMRRYNITWADSTSRSIEELSAIILQKIRQPTTPVAA
jgi:[pyruvate, water dikinase]-phosphate phosphotransferase / [pyruvate, water dikinase] kinase